MAETGIVRTVFRTPVPAQGTAGTAQSTMLGEAGVTGVLTEASLVPQAAVVFNASNYRTWTLFNRGTGAGTTVVATYDTSAVGFVDNVKKAMVLSATPANLVITQGDVLELVETTTGTGVAHGGFMFEAKQGRTIA